MKLMKINRIWTGPITAGMIVGGCVSVTTPIDNGLNQSAEHSTDDAALLDSSEGRDWPGYGRTYGEQHFSPLADVSDRNISRLGLAWSIDLGPGNPATVPVAADGVLYFSSGLSVIQAVNASTGRQLWSYDPQVGEQAGTKLRPAWGSRGIAYWGGKVYLGTQDGRLIALDGRNGRLIWSAMTVERDDGRYITGAPRIFDGKVIIGHGGADSANVRGYVTAYDATTGRQLWRFFTVPGNPADGFEDKAQEMAAKTWTGQWWKYGGGGTAWNAFAYDAEARTILIGTGNGAPWNQKIRSPGGGDNLFLCSIVALDADTGAYKWHYQINPGETWDYNAAMDIILTDLVIDGRIRKVAMTAPKNGFFYVIDRANGRLISAEKFSRVTWATGINMDTGRPEEVPGARFPDGKGFELWPSYTGAHSWMPMAFNPRTGLAYIPEITTGAVYRDPPVDLDRWKRADRDAHDMGVSLNPRLSDPMQNTSSLLAWNPVTQKPAWQVKTIGGWNGGILATGGNLVFQGQLDGRFSAYAANSGKELWHFAAQAAIIAAPISYRAGGRQYVTILVGMGTSPGIDKATHGGVEIDYRSQAKRVLTFVIDGRARLPKPLTVDLSIEDPGTDYSAEPALAARGTALFASRCSSCHGFDAVSGGTAPDLLRSAVVQSQDTFEAIVRGGALVANGMPKFEELSPDDLGIVRHYLRSRAATAANSNRH
ncbi:PQQ-dependent dehydrogenase, methanol/ethanol family [Sphingomonadaceae bacterium G21617-S1]|nr:PQQ-dependent dehydrogenase, methanol/ethanol family [Sphingomonadaceae bacterium G21617-S1]